jgi:hypothetical protein
MSISDYITPDSIALSYLKTQSKYIEITTYSKYYLLCLRTNLDNHKNPIYYLLPANTVLDDSLFIYNGNQVFDTKDELKDFLAKELEIVRVLLRYLKKEILDTSSNKECNILRHKINHIKKAITSIHTIQNTIKKL